MFSVFVCQIWSLQLVETHRSLCIPHFLGFSSSHEMRLENSVCQAPSPKEWQESAVLRGNFGRTSRCSLVPLNNQTDHRSRPACHQESTGILPIFSYMFFMCWEDRIITYIYMYVYYTNVSMSLISMNMDPIDKQLLLQALCYPLLDSATIHFSAFFKHPSAGSKLASGNEWLRWIIGL